MAEAGDDDHSLGSDDAIIPADTADSLGGDGSIVPATAEAPATTAAENVIMTDDKSDESLKSDGTASTAGSSGCSVATEAVTRASELGVGGGATSEASRREADNVTVRTLELSVFEAANDGSVVSSLVGGTAAGAADGESRRQDGGDEKRGGDDGHEESAMDYFYSALEAGTEVVLSSILPSCEEEERRAEEEEPLPGPSAMDLLAASGSDDEERSRRSREYRDARTKALGRERSRRDRASKASEKREAGGERARSKSASKSSRDDGGDGGGCLAFSCVGDDIHNEEALLNMQLEALLNERLEDMEDSLSNLDLIKKRHSDPFVKKMATAKQYLLMKRQRALILEHVGEDGARADAWRSRLRMLGRNIEVRRADVRRMKVKLESMGADDDDEGDSRRSGARGGDDDGTAADSRTDSAADSRTAITGSSVGDDDEVVGVFYREEEEVLDVVEAFRVFADYTAGRLDVLQRKGLWRMMVDD